MLKLLTILLISAAHAHVNKVQSDADLETELMPQELNPAFVPDKVQRDKDEPWKTVMPIRKRRDTGIIDATSANAIKLYSRIITCIILALSAIIEISVYLIESYVT